MINKFSLQVRVVTCASMVVLLTASGVAVAETEGVLPNQFLASTTATVTYLAEYAQRVGNLILSTASPDYLGTAYLTRFWSANDSVTFAVNAAVAGEYDIGLRYQNANSIDQTLSIYLNGVKLRQTKMAKLDDWESWDVKVERMSLKAGANKIEYQRDAADTGSVNVNNIFLTPVAASASSQPATFGVTASTPSIPSTSRHLYVATNGSGSNPGTQAAPFKTIQKASQLAVPSTTVHVAPGTYAGGFITSTSGTSSGRIYYVSDKKWGARIVPSASSTVQRAWTVTGNYVTINGFDIDGSSVSSSGTPWRIGVLTRSSNVSVENNHIHNIATKSADCTSVGGGGIVADSYYGGKNITMDRNLVHHLGPSTACKYIHGLYMSTSGTISNNIIHRVGYGGVHLWHDANKVNIVNNTIFNTPKAILVGTGQRYILTSPGDYINVANNILVDNDYGIIEENDGSGNGKNNFYVNNLYYRNRVNEAINSYNKPHISGSKVADPLFVRYQIDGSGDYHVKSGSPAISKGSATYAPAMDFDGKTRASVSADDLGAYEY